MQECRNIYQTPREHAGLTQESAAEWLEISVESLRAYETDRRIPPESTVLKMAEAYADKALVYRHLKYKNVIGAAVLPELEERTLAEATLHLLGAMRRIAEKRSLDRLVDIVEDGVVDEVEMEEYAEIIQELRGLVVSYFRLEYAK